MDGAEARVHSPEVILSGPTLSARRRTLRHHPAQDLDSVHHPTIRLYSGRSKAVQLGLDGQVSWPLDVRPEAALGKGGQRDTQILLGAEDSRRAAGRQHGARRYVLRFFPMKRLPFDTDGVRFWQLSS